MEHAPNDCVYEGGPPSTMTSDDCDYGDGPPWTLTSDDCDYVMDHLGPGRLITVITEWMDHQGPCLKTVITKVDHLRP